MIALLWLFHIVPLTPPFPLIIFCFPRGKSIFEKLNKLKSFERLRKVWSEAMFVLENGICGTISC